MFMSANATVTRLLELARRLDQTAQEKSALPFSPLFLLGQLSPLRLLRPNESVQGTLMIRKNATETWIRKVCTLK